jgi:hypothetical protein
LRTGDEWKRAEKPHDDRIDQWTHFLYDATNNAVSRSGGDQPYHLQWVADQNERSHDHWQRSPRRCGRRTAFYIADEGSTAAVALPARWRLVARCF